MSHTAIAVPLLPSLVLPGARAESPAHERNRPSKSGVWRRLSFWPAEVLRLVAVIYLFPIAILAIGIPLALTVNGLLLAAGWAWNALP